MEKEGKKDLFFKPLSEGLGFHPFSEGMPYAPLKPKYPTGQELRKDFHRDPQKPSMATGTGATAAGQSRMVVSTSGQKSQQRKEVPAGVVGSNLNAVQPQTIVRVSGVPASGPQTRPQTKWIPNSVQITPVSETRVEPRMTHIPTQVPPPRPLAPLLPRAVGRGILFRRGASFSIDLTLSWIFFLGGVVVYIAKVNSSFDPFANLRTVALLLGGGFAFHWALVCFQEVVFCNSFGKRVLGLRLKGSRARIFVRSLLFIPSFGLLMLGLVFGFFQKNRRCFHDWISGAFPELL